MTLEQLRRIEKVTDVRNVAAGVMAAYVDGVDGRPWLFTLIDDSLHSGISFDGDRERDASFRLAEKL